MADTDDEPLGQNWLMEMLVAELEQQGVDLESNAGVDALTRSYQSVLEDAGAALLARWRRHDRKLLKVRRRQRRSFERRLWRDWETAFGLLELLIAVAHDLGEDFNRRERPAAVERRDVLFEALVRLHARGCQVAREVMHLMRGGYAAGAHARWRTLHEITVTAGFLQHHGSDVAERYLLHDAVQSYKSMTQYVAYQERLGLETATEVEIDAVAERYHALCERFGKGYGSDYGWAADALESARPTFRELEESVSLDHLRPYYRLASDGVHAGSKAVYFNIGAFPGFTDALLTGSSNTGFADPGHGTAISLVQVTSTLLTLAASIDETIAIQGLVLLADEVGAELLKTQRMIEERAAKYSNPREC